MKRPRRFLPDGVAKGIGFGGQIGFEDGVAIVVKNVGEHASCVQIDAGVECVRLMKRIE